MLSAADVLRKKKEFFEKIYIDREVVQEASTELKVWYSGNKKKRTVILLMKKVLLNLNYGESFWNRDNLYWLYGFSDP